jgi:molybdopterin synthase catalytic subunit
MKTHIAITTHRIDSSEMNAFLRSSSWGALALFEGMVRDDVQPEQDSVCAIFYEAHESMAHAEMATLIQEAYSLFPIQAVYFHHLLGVVNVGETSVWLGISGKHRKEVFDAQTWILNQFKQRVPIWKKEIGQQSSKWVVPDAQ